MRYQPQQQPTLIYGTSLLGSMVEQWQSRSNKQTNEMRIGELAIKLYKIMCEQKRYWPTMC
jgi:hypothetical protein